MIVGGRCRLVGAVGSSEDAVGAVGSSEDTGDRRRTMVIIGGQW